jgi:hypothetical protein
LRTLVFSKYSIYTIIALLDLYFICRNNTHCYFRPIFRLQFNFMSSRLKYTVFQCISINELCKFALFFREEVNLCDILTDRCFCESKLDIWSKIINEIKLPRA